MNLSYSNRKPCLRTKRPMMAQGLAFLLMLFLLNPEYGVAGSLTEQRPPVVMLMLDTSASMQYVLASAACPAPSQLHNHCFSNDHADGCTACSSDGVIANCEASGTPIMSRWAKTTEILTGTFNEYKCNHVPRDYPMPHVHYEPSGEPAQYPDGLLDIHAGLIKFGLATFDSHESSLGDYGPATSDG